MRTRVMSGFLRAGAGQVDAEPVSLAFRGSSLFVEPQVQDVEGARSQAHGADASVLLRGDQSRVLEDAQVLQERWQRHGERCREFGHDGWGLRQPFHDGPARRIRKSAEHGVELIVILRHVPNYYRRAGIRQPDPPETWSRPSAAYAANASGERRRPADSRNSITPWRRSSQQPHAALRQTRSSGSALGQPSSTAGRTTTSIPPGVPTTPRRRPSLSPPRTRPLFRVLRLAHP